MSTKTENTYTAWEYDAMTGPSWCICNSEGAIADVWTCEAHARLIAAAPELLEALQNLVHVARGNTADEIAEAQAAIRKANGAL